MNNLVSKKGVRALAYPASDVSRLWPCTLKILYSEQAAQFTVSLKSYVSIQGVDDMQPVVLRFEGNNLVPSKGSLGPVNIVLTAEMINRLKRQGGHQLYVLSLVLKSPCALWHPRTLSVGASAIDNLPFELSALARTTAVCIVFDSKWLGNNLGSLQSAVEGSQHLTGIPVVPSSKFAQSYKRAHSPPYEPVKSETAPASPPIKDTQDDAPPAYAAQVPRKRPKHPHRSLTPDSPPSKRALLKDLRHSVSPTPSSQGARSTTSSNTTVVADMWQEAITRGLDKLLPELLPKLLLTILPDILPNLLAASRSPSPSQSPLHPSSSPANLPKVSALLSTHVKTHLKSIFSAAVEAAAESATSLAEAAVSDILEDHGVDLSTLKEDALAAMEQAAHEKVDAFHNEIEEVTEDFRKEVEEYACTVVGRAYDVLDEVTGPWVGDALSQHIEDEQASLAGESSGPVSGAKPSTTV